METVKTGVLIGSVVFSSISCIFLLYQCIVNFTKLRLACFLSTVAIFLITICNYFEAQPTFWGWVSLNRYWIIFALVRSLYTTILVVCMLDMGRKFYGENRWNTHLFKITILQLIAFDAANIVDCIIIYISEHDYSEFPLFLSQLILGVSTITSSFLYAFYPVLTIHMSKSTSPKQHVNAQSAAVGTWYMTITGILSIFYLILYLILFCFNDDFKYNPIGNACDAILRICITLAISLPPPSNIIHAMKMKIVERISTYNSQYNTV